MRVAYDLSILRHPAAGTTRYAVELRRAMGAQAKEDEIVDAHGWPRRARARRWRLPNLASDVGWLTIGADAFALRHGIDAWFGPANTLPLALPRPKVVTIHDTTFLTSGTHDKGYARYARVTYGAAGRRADAILAPSETTRQRLVEDLDIPAERITVAYPGLDHLASVAPAERDPATPARYALTVGQTEPHKNLCRLVEAWGPAIPPDLHLLIVGPPGRGEADLAAAIAASPVRASIVRLGSVDDATLARLYADATCFVFPSLAEGFGLPPLEAMALGIPTAVAAAGALPEVTAGAALMFDPLDLDAIAAAVGQIAEDADARADLIHRGPQVAGRYRWAGTAAVAWQALRQAASG